jgi:hypothetical protein
MKSGTVVRHPLSLPVLAYDLSRWQGFLLPVVIPSTSRLAVVVGESKDEIIQRIPKDFTGAFAFHINLTDSSRCPHGRAELVADLRARGIRTLNDKVVNISKRFVQAACQRAGLRTTTAHRQGDASEVLIVKTNRNYGGVPEARLSGEDLAALNTSAHTIYKQPDHGYLVGPRRDLPAAAWNDPNLIVERYIENRSRLFYRIYILCDRFALSEGREYASVKTIGRSDRQRLLLFSVDEVGNIDAAVPADLQPAIDAALSFVNLTGMDFGCLDMMRDDSDCFYIVDMNTTATWGTETETRIIEHLAPRIESQ